MPNAASTDEVRAALRGTVPALDGVRGVAILAVLGHQLCIDGYPGRHALGPTLALLPFQAGWVGVQLFFVLSGFLITGILLDTRRAQNYWSSFYVRRGLRIFPLYYLLLLGTFVVAPRLLHLSEATLAEHRHQGFYWLYLANLPAATGGAVDTLGHCWSLSVEEQFYLVWPLVVRLLDERGLARVCAGIAAFALLLRVGICITGASPELAYELTPARADALALGALAAVVVRRAAWLDWIAPRLGRASALAWALLVVLTLASGVLARINPVTLTAGQTVLAAVSALVIVQATLETARGGGRLAAGLSVPSLRRYGKYSYAIYVLHHPLNLFVTRTFLEPRLAGLTPGGFLALQAAYFVGGALALLLLGAASYRLVERPILAYKRHFAARPAVA